MMSNELEWEVNAFFICLTNEESDKTSASFDLTWDHFMGGTSADLKSAMISIRAPRGISYSTGTGYHLTKLYDTR